MYNIYIYMNRYRKHKYRYYRYSYRHIMTYIYIYIWYIFSGRCLGKDSLFGGFTEALSAKNKRISRALVWLIWDFYGIIIEIHLYYIMIQWWWCPKKQYMISILSTMISDIYHYIPIFGLYHLLPWLISISIFGVICLTADIWKFGIIYTSPMCSSPDAFQPTL